MKHRILSILTLLLTLAGAGNLCAQTSELAGKLINVGASATTLETGKWYVLYNAYSAAYTCEGEGNTLGVTTTTPHGKDAVASANYLVTLEEAGEGGKYFLKSGLGNYYRNVTGSKNNGTEPTTRATSIYTISQFNTPGHWTLRSNNMYYLQNNNGQLLGNSGSGAANGDRDWEFREVNLKDIGELTGSAYVKYVLQKGGLVRLTNRRATNRNLADNGTNTVGAAKSDTDLHQVWILAANGNGYSLRNGSTGRFLDDADNFRTPSASAQKIHIRMSPNNTGDQAFINLSKDENYGGNCLNLNNDGSTLYKWKAEGDQGSDWTITQVENYTLDEVLASLLANSDFTTPEAGKYYRIKNLGYKTYMNENYASNRVSCEGQNKEKLSQYWTLVDAGSGRFMLQNVCTQRNIVRQNGARSQQYKTEANKNGGFLLSRTDDPTDVTYYITDAGSVGLHCDAGASVVGWVTSGIPASTWGFEEVELTDDFIAQGRADLNAFNSLMQNRDAYQAVLDKLFEDKACTQLKATYQGMTDEQLAADEDYAQLNESIQQMILKVKNDNWESFTTKSGYSRDKFEKFFRVRDDYKVYSNHQEMAWETGMSSAYGKLSNPTGIVGNTGDIIYIYVDQEPSADCTLQVEVIEDSASPGDRQTGATTTLHAGLNAIALNGKSTVYIFYQLNDINKKLADYPDMKIHIEGGQVQGYFDMTRGMTNQDWKLLRETMLKYGNVLNLKTDRLVFAMRSDLVQQGMGTANEMEGTLRIWNNIIEVEEDIMGFKDETEGRFRNVWNCFSVNHGYMYATTYGTYYSDGTVAEVMNYNNLTHNSGALWGPAHEMGHNHQACINVVGATEVSNNLFSNIVVFLHGTSTTRGTKVGVTLDSFAKGQHWIDRDIWQKTRMYYQLYLYYHVQGHKPDFYPTLFKMLRKDPIAKRTGGWDESVGGNITLGTRDYLHMAKKMCDAAGEDLSEFFEVMGMFIPVEKRFVDDYAQDWITTTQADIDAVKKYMHRYPKGPNLSFIDDRIKQSAVIENSIFEGVTTGEFRKDYDENRIGESGDLGQWSDYVKDYQTSGYYYTSTYSQGVTTYAVTGKGAVGYKMYDLEGNLVFLSNMNKFTLPANVQEKVKDGFRLYAAEGNGYDVLVPYGPAMYRGEMTVYYEGGTTPHTVYYYGTGDAGKSEMSALPANSIAYVKAGQTAKKLPTEELLKNANVVDGDGVAQAVVIDGDKAFHAPTAFQANSLTFTKSGSGKQALKLPFAVQNGTTITEDGALSQAETIAAGSPVVVEGKVSYNLTNVSVEPITTAVTESGYTLASDGLSVAMAADIAPFTYVWDKAFDIETAIQQISVDAAQDGVIYNIAGQRVNSTTRPGMYILNGRKVLVK